MDVTKTPEELLQEQLTAKTNEVTELQRKLTAETTAHTNTRQELTDANTLIDDLNKQLDAKKDGPAEHIVTQGVGKNARNYRVTLPKFNFEGTVYRREDVQSGSELLKKLVALGSVVELVEAAE